MDDLEFEAWTYRKSSLAIFACFVKDSSWGPHHTTVVQGLSKTFDRVIVPYSTASGKPIREDLHGAKTVWYENHALCDFALFWHIIQFMEHDQFLKVCLINDSTRPIGPVLPQYIFEVNKPFYGLTKNFGGAPSYSGQIKLQDNEHIQSYFLMFTEPESVNAMIQFFRHKFSIGLQTYDSYPRGRLIQEFEIGLSQWMKSRNYALHSLYTCELIQHAFNINVPQNYNISYFQYDLLAILGCPLIKVKRHTVKNHDDVWLKRLGSMIYSNDLRQL